MNLESLKSEALKLKQAELLELAQFILAALVEDENQLGPTQILEVEQRLQNIQDGKTVIISGHEAEKELSNKYALDV